MIPHTLICKIYVLRLTTLVCNELRYSLLDYEAGNSYLLSCPIIRIPIYLGPKSFVFVFLGERLIPENTKSRPSFSIVFDGN